MDQTPVIHTRESTDSDSGDAPGTPVILFPRGRQFTFTSLRWWITGALVVAVVAWDWHTVAPPPMRNHLLRFAILLGIASLLEITLKGTPLPLYRPNIFRALKILAKIILWGALVTIILVGGAILLARWGGVRWTLIPQNVRHPDHYWIVFVSSVLWAPIIEELTYRGVVQARLRQCVGIWPAIFLSALTFWIYHWISFRTITSPHHFGAGLLMAYSYERSRSLVAPIILHALGNLILISGDLFYLTHRGFVERLLGYS